MKKILYVAVLLLACSCRKGPSTNSFSQLKSEVDGNSFQVIALDTIANESDYSERLDSSSTEYLTFLSRFYDNRTNFTRLQIGKGEFAVQSSNGTDDLRIEECFPIGTSTFDLSNGGFFIDYIDENRDFWSTRLGPQSQSSIEILNVRSQIGSENAIVVKAKFDAMLYTADKRFRHLKNGYFICRFEGY